MKIWIYAVVFLFLAGCGNKEYKSSWRTNEIIVDGLNRDWQGNLIYDKDNDIAIGIVNDETNLYLTVGSTDRAMIQKIMRGGFTVWFNSKGNKDKTIGIRYPTGGNGDNIEFPKRYGGYDDYPGERPIERIERSWGEFTILKDKKDSDLRIPVENEVGIEVSNSFYEGMFVYELKFPLNENSDFPYAIGAGENGYIGIGFETGKMENKFAMNRMNRAGMSGGRGGRRGGRQGGGRMNAGNKAHLMEPLNYWIKVELANENR